MADYDKITTHEDQKETERLLRANCLPEIWGQYKLLIKRCQDFELDSMPYGLGFQAGIATGEKILKATQEQAEQLQIQLSHTSQMIKDCVFRYSKRDSGTVEEIRLQGVMERMTLLVHEGYKTCLAGWTPIPKYEEFSKLILPERDLPVLWLYESGLLYLSDIPHDHERFDIERFLSGTSDTGPVTHWIDPKLILPESEDNNA